MILEVTSAAIGCCCDISCLRTCCSMSLLKNPKCRHPRLFGLYCRLCWQPSGRGWRRLSQLCTSSSLNPQQVYPHDSCCCNMLSWAAGCAGHHQAEAGEGCGSHAHSPVAPVSHSCLSSGHQLPSPPVWPSPAPAAQLHPL